MNQFCTKTWIHLWQICGCYLFPLGHNHTCNMVMRCQSPCLQQGTHDTRDKCLCVSHRIPTCSTKTYINLLNRYDRILKIELQLLSIIFMSFNYRTFHYSLKLPDDHKCNVSCLDVLSKMSRSSEGAKRFFRWRSMSSDDRLRAGTACECAWRSTNRISSRSPLLSSTMITLQWCGILVQFHHKTYLLL
jgi:hypothetical protein